MPNKRYIPTILAVTLMTISIARLWEQFIWVAYFILACSVIITFILVLDIIDTFRMRFYDRWVRRESFSQELAERRSKVDLAFSQAERGVLIGSISQERVEFQKPSSAAASAMSPDPLQLKAGLPSLPKYVRLEDFIVEEPRSIRNMVIGQLADGQVKTVDFTRLIHTIVSGMSGSGKSEFLHVLLTQLLLSKEQVDLDLIDLGADTFTSYDLPYARTVPEAEAIFDKWNREFQLRRQAFERTRTPEGYGIKNLDTYNEVTGENLPYTVVCIEEGAELLADSDMIEESVRTLVAQARKYGLSIIFITQSAKANAMDTTIRGNFVTRVQFPIQEKSHARMLIPGTSMEELSCQGRGRFDSGYGQNFLFQAPIVADSTRMKASQRWKGRGGRVLDFSQITQQAEILSLEEEAKEELPILDIKTGWPIITTGTSRERMTAFAEYMIDMGINLRTLKPAEVLDFYKVIRNGRNYGIWSNLVSDS